MAGRWSPMPGPAYRLRALCRRRRLHRRRLPRLILLPLLPLALLFLTASRHFYPIVKEMAVAEAGNAVSVVINNAIAEKLAQGELRYNDIVTLEKNDDGRITAIVTDMSKVNLLKSEITAEIIRALSGDVKTRLRIPLGNVTGLNLLSGKGPYLPVEIVAVPMAHTEFVNRFSSAGINQTRHRIVVLVNAAVSVLIPGGNAYAEVNAEVTVAETVIVGEVPETYTYFESDENWDDNLERYDITS